MNDGIKIEVQSRYDHKIWHVSEAYWQSLKVQVEGGYDHYCIGASNILESLMTMVTGDKVIVSVTLHDAATPLAVFRGRMPRRRIRGSAWDLFANKLPRDMSISGPERKYA